MGRPDHGAALAALAADFAEYRRVTDAKLAAMAEDIEIIPAVKARRHAASPAAMALREQAAAAEAARRVARVAESKARAAATPRVGILNPAARGQISPTSGRMGGQFNVDRVVRPGYGGGDQLGPTLAFLPATEQVWTRADYATRAAIDPSFAAAFASGHLVLRDLAPDENEAEQMRLDGVAP